MNVELEVGLSNPFVSEYPIARLASEYWYSMLLLQNIAQWLNIPALGGNIRAGAVSMGISHCEFN